MRSFSLPLIASALLFSAHVAAKPELAPAALLDFGSFEKVDELVIYGDIEQNIIVLAEKNTSESDADLFVIDEISEDIDRNLLVVTVSLYNDLDKGLVMR